MGRHRRSGGVRAAATPEKHPGRTTRHRRGNRASAPVRTGLLGVSAAVAMGAVAVGTGVLPGGDGFRLGDETGPGKVRAATAPAEVDTQGGAGVGVERGEPSPSRGSGRAQAPAPAPSQAAPEPSRTPSEKPSTRNPKAEAGKKTAPGPSRTPERERAPEAPPKSTAPAPSAESAAETSVLTLVNEERAKAGCRPVTADSGLAALAGEFSSDMAGRDFFDHTDPDGATPWDRAEKAGITDLGGENIARGQANARSVMDAWMNSSGHRANILNCDYKTLGVGVHFAPGGPWWTQDFGF
ncbi:CAP domain-containing protein [Streptomyces alfalfae]|uniref:CAP domain-containing protein n=1 Tax=Streptomyces alfalfae TaxID=1642299 RepID=A0A7T4TZX5_9ACTN|nr:CAP domain-containing protein [Streptomyces alfalfae]QQC91610.1 CAP domain-containing protein [Streptomyces alfalfae]